MKRNKKGQFVKKLYSIKCGYCQKIFLPKASKNKFCSRLCFYNSLIGIKHSEERKEKISGINSYNWKDNITYSGIHIWVKREKGKPKVCQLCGENKRKIAWANIDHKYRRILDDYISLCYSCHNKFDNRGFKNSLI